MAMEHLDADEPVRLKLRGRMEEVKQQLGSVEAAIARLEKE